MSKLKLLALLICVLVVSLFALRGYLTQREDRRSESDSIVVGGTSASDELSKSHAKKHPTNDRKTPPVTTKASTPVKQALDARDEAAMRRLGNRLTGRDLAVALGDLLKDTSNWRMLRAFLAGWADRDPMACATWTVANLQKGGNRSYVLQYAVSKWAEKNPYDALKWALALTTEQGRDTALGAVFQTWANLDPKTAASELQKIEDFRARDLALGMIAYYWARKDYRGATDWAWNLPKSPGRTYALANVAREIYETDKAKGGEWAKTLPAGYTNNSTLARIAAFLTGLNSGESVADIAARIPGGPAPAPSLQIQIARWAVQDPASAIAWANQLSNDRAKERALTTISEAVSSANAAATQTEDTTPAGSAPPTETTTDKQANSMLPPEILLQDLSVAVLLAEELPDGDARNGIMHSVALQWAEEDPAAAVAWVLREMPESRELDATVKTIVWDWASKSSDQALAWANALVDPTKQIEAVATVAMSLATTNSGQAITVAATIPIGDTRDNVIENIAFKWATVDANAASAWAQTLTAEQGSAPALRGIQRATSR